MKKVVVIGGGFTGAYCALNLQTKFEVTLIDDKDYFEYTPGILRTIINPSHLKKIQSEHKNYLKNAKFIKGQVTKVSKKEVIINNKKIKFDYLIIASGSSYDAPIKEHGVISATRANELVNYHKTLENSNSILIIGGGLVGVELAGEIITKYKDKKVTIINSGDKLIPRNSPKSIKYATDFLLKKGVKIIPNQRVIEKKDNVCFTDKGNKIKCEMYFLCTGIVPNYDFMKKNFSNLLTEKGQIKVNKFLQLENHKNIFSGGDVTSILEEKTAQTAEAHAKLIMKNIINLERNLLLEEYRSKTRSVLISLGKNRGIFEKRNFILSGFIPAILKSYVEWKTMRKYK